MEKARPVRRFDLRARRSRQRVGWLRAGRRVALCIAIAATIAAVEAASDPLPMRSIEVTPQRVKEGKALFVTCAACHGLNGEGRMARLDVDSAVDFDIETPAVRGPTAPLVFPRAQNAHFLQVLTQKRLAAEPPYISGH